MKKQKIMEVTDTDRTSSLSSGRCVFCDKRLSRTTFRDKNGEVDGWIVECVNCDVVYDED